MSTKGLAGKKTEWFDDFDRALHACQAYSQYGVHTTPWELGALSVHWTEMMLIYQGAHYDAKHANDEAAAQIAKTQ